MRPRTFILLILVLLVGAVAAVLLIARSSDGGLLSNLGGDNQPAEDVVIEDGVPVTDGGEDGSFQPQPLPTPTPVINLVPVVVAKTDLPVGTQLRPDLLTVEERPDSNIALQGGYTFDDIEAIIGSYVRVPISKDQAVLRPMLALNPSDLSQFGSDLGLYVENGRVAVAFPIDALSGAAYAMRPGDNVDVLMSLSLVKADEEFNTPLPNVVSRVDAEALANGQSFLLPEALQGRLELVPQLDIVAEIVPGTNTFPGFEPGQQIPRRVTQLTVQNAQVLWVGTWKDPRILEKEEEQANDVQPVGAEGDGSGETAVIQPTPTPLPQRFDNPPDLVILSLPAQDALSLKWALEVGLDLTLVLRAQGDTTPFTTTSVSLPQIIEQGGLIRPEPGEYLLSPPWQDVPAPSLPVEPPGGSGQ